MTVNLRFGRRIALGLTDYLIDFAPQHDAEPWTEFAKDDPMNWRYYFLEAISDPGVTAYFDLTGIHVWVGVQRASGGGGGPTDWELLQIQQHEIWWPRIVWFRDGISVPNPFQ